LRDDQTGCKSCAAEEDRPHFVIADAIVAMEGDGPLNGTPKFLNIVLLADDAVTADATLARLMEREPSQIVHIREAGLFLGNVIHERTLYLS